MSGCCAYGCKNRSENQKPGITFHLFPKDSTRRKAWTLAVKRKNFRPTNFTRICSEHFAEECFNRASKKYIRLHPDAVPTIFRNYPKNLQNASNLTPLTKFYSEDIIIKKSESDEDIDDDLDEEEEIDAEDEYEEEIGEGEDDYEEEEEDDDSMSESESSEESSHEAPPETEVVYVSEEFADTDQPSLLKVIPGTAPKPAKKPKLDKGVMDALSAYAKLQRTSASDDLKEDNVSVVLVQPPPKDDKSILTPQELVNMEPDALNELYEHHKRELKALRQKTRRYQEKIARLEKIIDNFKNYKSSADEDGNDLSEDNISVDEIYEQLLKNQKEDSGDTDSDSS